MPTFILHYKSPNIKSNKLRILQDCARSILSEEIGKSPAFVLTMINFCENMSFGDSPAYCAFVEVKNVGKMDPEITS